MSRRTALPLALLLAASAATPALADTRRPSQQEQDAQALARLSLPDLRTYCAARRELEQRQSSQRQEALKETEGCVLKARDAAVVERCQKQFIRKGKEARRSQMNQLAELQRRYNLPGWGAERGGEKDGSQKPGKGKTDNNKGA
ncbi:MAG: hypothetical protein ACKOPS_09805 [Cyanobium sp.]